MNKTLTQDAMVARRGELLAELFLEELQPEFVARATPDFAYDFLVGFRNTLGGVSTMSPWKSRRPSGRCPTSIE